MSKTAKAMNPSDINSSTGLPYNHTRLGECANCGGDVTVASSNGGVPKPPTCLGCGAEMAQPLKMRKDTGKASGGKAAGALAAWRKKHPDGQRWRGR